jgi:hypothetical protein
MGFGSAFCRAKWCISIHECVGCATATAVGAVFALMSLVNSPVTSYNLSKRHTCLILMLMYSVCQRVFVGWLRTEHSTPCNVGIGALNQCFRFMGVGTGYHLIVKFSDTAV